MDTRNKDGNMNTQLPSPLPLESWRIEEGESYVSRLSESPDVAEAIAELFAKSGLSREEFVVKFSRGELPTRSTVMRSRERLHGRQDRRCANCGETFTPKNSLGKTCSTRCRVALCRKKAKPATRRKKK